MLERVAAWFLNTYVAEYVGNLNTDQLSIGLLSGAVELEKLTLKKDALHKLKLPIEVKAGYIGKLRLTVPVRYMKSQPWVVEIDQLYIVAGPPDITKFDPEEEKIVAQTRKLSKLARMEQKWREEQQSGKSTWFWSSFATSFSSTIAENLQVTINNIHVRYEDPEVSGGKPLVVGLIIDKITAQSTNENWEPHFGVDGDKSHKAVDISNLNVYWDTELLGDLQATELLDAMLHKTANVIAMSNMMSSSLFFDNAPIIRHLIKPLSATAQITRNCSKQPLKIVDGPRVNVNVIIQEVPIVLSENQLQQFANLSDLFQMRWKSQKYMSLRPKVSIQQSPKVWWQFATHCVIKDIKDRNERLSMAFILTRARQCVSYVSAYTIHLTSATPTEEVKEILHDVEEVMNYEDIVILRRLAMQRVEKERALAEEAKRLAAAEVEQQGIVQRWFPEWISGYHEEGQQQNGGSLEHVDEEELLDELGLEMDGNSQLLKDRIFANVTFSLNKGTLNLVTEGNGLGATSLLELELSQLSCHVDYRPRLKYSFYEVRLGGLYIEDNYHDNSVFTTLVQPKQSKEESLQSDDLLLLRLTLQDRPPFSQGYSIHVLTRPLDVVFNKTTMSRLKQFFAFTSVTSELSRGTSKVGGAMGGVNPKLLDSISIKLDISAPHIIIPERFDDIDTPKVIINLGHLDFESVSEWSHDIENDSIVPLQELVYQMDDIDDDEEFVTPPSSPPSESESAEPSPLIQPHMVQRQFDIKKKSSPHNKYLLKLSDFQLLVGNFKGLSWDSNTMKGNKNLHLLDRVNLLVKIQRNAVATVDTPYLLIGANLPLLNFHIDEHKVCTLLACFTMPPLDSTQPSTDTSNNTVTGQQFKDNEAFINNSLTTTSVYHSAYNVFDKSSNLKKQSSEDKRHRMRHSSAPDSSQVKLVQAKMSIDHFLMGLTYEDVCLAELKVLGVKGGVTKRVHDTSLRMIIKDLFLIDKIQEHHPQYELILSSNAISMFPLESPIENKEGKFDDDIFTFDGEFLLNVIFNQYSCLSVDYPRRNNVTDGMDIRKLLIQCTAINAIANQELIVKFIGFCRKIIAPLEKINNAPPINIDETNNTSTPVDTELSVEFEKFSLKLIRGSNRFGSPAKRVEPSTFILTAAIDLIGLGIEASVGNEIIIQGHLEGAMVQDKSHGGQKYPLVVSVGTCRDGRNIDMVATMMTSYHSLIKQTDVISFCLKRTPRVNKSSQQSIGTATTVYDVSVTIHIPSVLYTHSVNFIREMEIFTIEFKQYFSSITSSVKTAALEVAKGLVSDESHLVHGLNKLSSTLGAHLLPRDEDFDDDNGDTVEDIEYVGFGDVDRVIINVLVMSPVVIIPSSMTSSNTLVAHLGKISLKNEYINLSDNKESPSLSGCVMSSSEVDQMILKISNMSLNASHDDASLDWLKRDDTDGVCAGKWSQIMKETSFELVIERAVGGVTNHMTSDEDDSEDNPTVVDVSISCSLSKSLFISLSKQVFDQIKCTAKTGIYIPLPKSSDTPMETPTNQRQTQPPQTTNETNTSTKLPRIVANFSLPQLSIEFLHIIGDEEKKIVFVSFEEFLIHCRKTIPHHTFIDLGLKTIIVEDLLQTNDMFRYIMSSTQNPIPFSSPVNPHSTVLSGISPRSFLPLSHLISSPKPQNHFVSPLRLFNPYTHHKNDSIQEDMTTPPSESSASTITDIQDLFSINVHHVTESSPDYISKYKGIGLHADVAFSTVYLVINLQTWVVLFDYLGIGVPTPPSSPVDNDTFFFQNINEDGSMQHTVDPNLYSLKQDGSILIKETPSETKVEEPCKSTVWGVEGKISCNIKLKVRSLTVTLNKSEHMLARGVACGLKVDATLDQSNVAVKGSLGQASLVDLTDTGAYYRDKFTTVGDQALNFDVYKFGQRDPNLERPYDISVSVHLSAVRYLHTMRFLKEVIAFLTHFPQLIDAFQRMKAAKRGDLNYTPDRKPRILLEIEADSPMILIPKHAFSPEIMGGVINKLTLCNSFLWDGQEGTLSVLRGLEKKTSRFSYTNELSTRYNSVPGNLSSLINQSYGPSSNSSLSYSSSTNNMRKREDQMIKDQVAAKSGPCLLDSIELVLSDVDVFSAKKTRVHSGSSSRDGWAYEIQRDKGKLLKEKGTLRLQIERNLYEDFCRDVPDIHIDGTLSAVHLMLDKRQLEIIKGLIDMNLGEEIDEFEKPSTVIHDPIAQHAVAAIWTGFRFHLEFVGVQLEFLRSRPLSDLHIPQSLALFDIQLSEFTFESHSNQSKNVDFTTHAVVGRDTRYDNCSSDAKPNVFEEVLKPHHSTDKQEATKKSLQFEIHVFMSPTTIKASILLNGLRLIGVFDLLLELKTFIIDKLPEEYEEETDHNTSLEEVDSATLSSLRSNIVSQLGTTHKQKKTDEKKPDRDVTLHLSVTGTDFLVVEDLRNLASNAVVLKGTLVLTLKSPPRARGATSLHCSVDNLELFSCIVSNEDDTALSILDPVSIGVELKSLEGLDMKGTHLLEFDVKQLNVRLSYNDIKLFVAILQSLKVQSLKMEESKVSKRLSLIKNEKLVKKLLPLGFSRSAILHELGQSGGDIEIAASRLIEENVMGNNEEQPLIKLDRIMVVMGSVNLCLIDDSLNHDIPLIELTLLSVHANHQLIDGMHGTASTQLALDYYNRNISAWEPIIEPWNVKLLWRKTTGFDLDTNEKPDRLNFSVTSTEQLCVNVTSTLLHLFKETQASWQSDYKNEHNDNDITYPHHNNDSNTSTTSSGSAQSPVTTPNVQQGLALLHTVRYISQSRQRNKFIPFALRNSTGLHLSFTTLTSLPSEVLITPSVSLGGYSRRGDNVLTTPSNWIDVDSMEEKPFDFLPHQKMRHKDTRALIVHQLKVKVDGWEETTIPISVDKIGVFFRDLYPSVGSSHGPVRLVFAISLSDTRKIVNVRSGLVIHNKLELPMEIKMEPPQGTKCSSVSLPVIKSVSYYAIPLHLTHWVIYIRPQGWGLKFCSYPLLWESTRIINTDSLRECVTIGGTGNMSKSSFRFCVKVNQEPFPPMTLKSVTSSPGHTLSLHPPLTVSNLLPFDICFCYSQKEKRIPHGKMVPFYTVNPQENIKFTISKLEGFTSAEACTISTNDVGMVQYLVMCDKRNRKLFLRVKTELIGQCSLKVLIWCSYWIVNRTGLALVFSAEGDSTGEPSAGQYEEHETASTVTPLLFAFSDRDLIQKCQVTIGRSTGQGLPKWSSGFRMLKNSQVIRLFVKQGQGRPDREYQIGMEIHRGTHQYNETRVVTFVARFQLENRTAFKLAYVQRHSLTNNNLTNHPTILPSAIMAFHWPRTDLDQLLCIKVEDLEDSYWSSGFPLEHDKSSHINMRRSFGRSVFVRCEILQRGETYRVIFLDACDYPPPFKLENLSQVQVICYQSGVAQNNHMLTQLNPGQSVPYAWDDIILAEKLCVHVKTGLEPRCFDFESVGSKGKVYYESYFYIVAMGTKRMESGTEEDLVLDVPQGKAVIITNKNIERRSQLWRMTADGHLVHVVSSNTSTNYVLDLVEPIAKGRYHNNTNISLMINKVNTRKSDTQTWKFTQDGHLVLMNYDFLCVQMSKGYDTAIEGTDAVLGRIDTGSWREEFGRVKQSPGSGVLSVTIVQDGPTRILRITDENKKYTYSCIQDDWMIVDNGIVSPVNVSDVDPPEDEDASEDDNNGPKMELSLSLSLDKGVGVSLINSVPEELLFASASGIRIEYNMTTVHQCISVTIQYIQVDNQTIGGYSPVLAFPSLLVDEIEYDFPVLNCTIERLPHQSPFAIVFRTFEFTLREFTILMEERLLFKLLQWAGIGVGGDNKEESIQEEMMTKTMHRSPTSSTFPSHQVYIEQLRVSTTNLFVCMHTTSQLPLDLSAIKRRLGFPLIQFESPIILEGFQTSHMLGTPVLYADTIGKHYKHVLERQAIKILGSVDFLGNPVGLISDVASGVQGMIALQPDVVGLVRNVTHGMSDTTSKLTGTVSHVLGQATGDSTYQEEREQNLVSCQSSGDHFQAGLINLTGGLFGGVTSIITQPYKGAVEDGFGGFLLGIGKGVVGTVAKPVAGLLDFASGTTAAIRESMSRYNRNVPRPVRLRRCCVGATGALTCYSLQLARGEEYLMRLNDGDNRETLVSYEKIDTGTKDGIRVIISSKALYFFEESPPDLTSLNSLIKLDNLIECRAIKAKTTIPINYVMVSMATDEQEHGVKSKRFKCEHEQTTRKITQLINYAKNLHEEEKMVIRTPRLQNEVLW